MPSASEPGAETANEPKTNINPSSESEDIIINSSVVSQKEETEEEILNKIETEAMDVGGGENLDSHAEDSILNEEEEHRQTDKNEEHQQTDKEEEHQQMDKEEEHQQTDKDEDNIVLNSIDDDYENSADREFKSLYEEDCNETPKVDQMEVDQIEEPVVDKVKENEPSTSNGPDNKTQINEEPEKAIQKPLEPTVPMPIKEEPDDEEEESKVPDVPDETPTDKSPEDEVDLLDISMVRETEEDDACAIADALDDKETQRSDEDQSEKAETEQDNSDGDGATQDDDGVTQEDDGVTQEDDGVTQDDDAPTQDDDNTANGFADDNNMECDNDKEASKEIIKEEEAETKEIVVEENDLVVVEDDAALDKTDIIDRDKEADEEEVTIDEVKVGDDKRKSKRTLSINGTDKPNAKKPKLLNNEKPIQNQNEPVETQNRETSLETPLPPKEPEESYKVQTLKTFAEIMKCQTLTNKLTRSNLEEICLQKICEAVVLKTSNGQLHDTIRKHEEALAAFRKDINQMNKQYRDLDIVHKKLLAELKTLKEEKIAKPLVPLKITRSVGLQVRLTPGHDANQTRNRRPSTVVQQKGILSPLGRQVVKKVVQQPTPARQVASPQKPLAKPAPVNSAPMLSQALQKTRPKQIIAKRTTISPIKKPAEIAKKPLNPGVIDLTDEDDKRSGTNGIKFRTVPANARVVSNGNKAPVGGAKSSPTQNKPANKLPTALPQGLRLTPSGNSTTSSPQMVYVVPTITSNAGGQQKVAFVNFQPSLSGTLNGAVLNKPGQSLTIKNIAATSTVSSSSRSKHPAPLPVAIRANSDPNLKLTLPKPLLTIKKLDNGIILQWKMPYNLDLYEKIASYQLYAYQESTALPSSEMWRKVGDVKALALPMACTLTQFADKNKYYFAVRAVDVYTRIGAFSDPEEISL
ncbi:unnamed protein product [Ceutorhynchus assimilis]|uniref:Activating transcription factor 7-interacting protein Fn3 domain-containing protein n=1 Tax=Ceutorhynchus assimilis TaxID=467358 RepID=A0A9N9QFY5_9CUCU|nr:unnamed protein product [Ceutorhynchus assimilis]